MVKTFKELLGQCPNEEIINYVLGDEPEQEEVDAYNAFFEEIAALEPVSTDSVLVGVTLEDESDVLLFNKTQLKNEVIEDTEILGLDADTIYKMSGNDALEFLDRKIMPRDSAYQYESWEEILGFEIIDKNVEKFGLLKFVGTVVAAMTYFATNKAEVDEVRKLFNDTLAMKDTQELAQTKIRQDEPGAHMLIMGFGTRDGGVKQEIKKIESTKLALKNKIIEYKEVLDCLKSL